MEKTPGKSRHPSVSLCLSVNVIRGGEVWFVIEQSRKQEAETVGICRIHPSFSCQTGSRVKLSPMFWTEDDPSHVETKQEAHNVSAESSRTLTKVLKNVGRPRWRSSVHPPTEGNQQTPFEESLFEAASSRIEKI